MNFFERVEHNLLSNDLVIQEFILHVLHDLSHVNKAWIERLLTEAIHNDAKRDSILVYCPVDPMHEEIVSLIIEGIQNSPAERRHLYIHMIEKLSPSILLKNKDVFEPFFKKDDWLLFDILVNGSKQRVVEEFEKVIDKLDAEQTFNGGLYRNAKKIAFTLVQNNWITDTDVEELFEKNANNDWFDYDGILAVYMIGLKKNEKYIHKLSQLLIRDEDILLEEVAATLISMQSNEVVDAVAPYLFKEESNIFAASIVENCKSDYAIEVLREAYNRVVDEDSKAMIIEALAHQLSIVAEPEINDYVSRRPHTFLYSIEELAYSYYKIIGVDHPLLEEWKTAIYQNGNGLVEDHFQLEVQKVGRNEPCPCGSGKKYKKCCLN